MEKQQTNCVTRFWFIFWVFMFTFAFARLESRIRRLEGRDPLASIETINDTDNKQNNILEMHTQMIRTLGNLPPSQEK